MSDPWMVDRIRHRTTHLVCYIVCYIVNVRYRMGSRRIAISYGISYACYIPYEIVLRYISRNRIGYSSHTISHVYDIVDPVYDVLFVFVCFLVHARAGSNAALRQPRSGSVAPLFESNATAARLIRLSVFFGLGIGLQWFTNTYRASRVFAGPAPPPPPPLPRRPRLWEENDGRSSARRHTTPQAYA